MDKVSGVSAKAVKLPVLDSDGGQGATVVVLPVKGTIDMGMSGFIERSLKNNQNAAAVIFDINTPGGRIDAATRIRDAIMALPESVHSVAFVHPRAISAGAFISFACDYIFIADGGSMGAATPITIDEGKANPVSEKFVSYFRTEMASTARAKGRNGQIAAAMVDADVSIDGITIKGKLLTLDTNGALKNHIANKKANSLNDVKKLLALPKADVKKESMNWAEKLARIFTDPVLTGILMSIGMLGLLIELYHPGFGLPGIVGITALTIFFAGHLVVNLAGYEDILLFAAGVMLLGLEIFVIPGFGIAGVLGIVAIVASLVMSLTALPFSISWQTGEVMSAFSRVALSMLVTVILLIAAIAVLPKQRFFRSRFVLDAAIRSTTGGGVEGEVIKEVVSIGAGGVAMSDLRPSGIAVFKERRIDVVTEGGYIEHGSNIKVLRVEGNRVIVCRLKDNKS